MIAVSNERIPLEGLTASEQAGADGRREEAEARLQYIMAARASVDQEPESLRP